MQFSPTGTLLNTLNGVPTSENTGMAFLTLPGNLYVTGFSGNIKQRDDNLRDDFVNKVFGSRLHWESGVDRFRNAAAGDFYESAKPPSGWSVWSSRSSTRRVRRRLASTSRQSTRGSDWIDLAADQCTLFNTSEGDLVKRFDVCTNTQLPDFATLAVGRGVRASYPPNGDVLVAATAGYRLDSTGALDPDGYVIPGASVLVRTEPRSRSARRSGFGRTSQPATSNRIGISGAVRTSLGRRSAPLCGPTVGGSGGRCGELTAATANTAVSYTGSRRRCSIPTRSTLSGSPPDLDRHRDRRGEPRLRPRTDNKTAGPTNASGNAFGSVVQRAAAAAAPRASTRASPVTRRPTRRSTRRARQRPSRSPRRTAPVAYTVTPSSTRRT